MAVDAATGQRRRQQMAVQFGRGGFRFQLQPSAFTIRKKRETAIL
jgi:hypothetical protein